MKCFADFLFLAFFAGSTFAAELQIRPLDRNGSIAWENAFSKGVLTLETAPDVTGPWSVRPNVFTTNSAGAAAIALPSSNTFVRALAVDISTNTPRHYTNLTESYGILETVAGRGEFNGDR